MHRTTHRGGPTARVRYSLGGRSRTATGCGLCRVIITSSSSVVRFIDVPVASTHCQYNRAASASKSAPTVAFNTIV